MKELIATQEERWRTVQGFPEYMVSDIGRVVSLKMKKIRLMTGTLYQGYPCCSLRIKGQKLKLSKIHRLVLIAFKGDPPKGHQASHLDGNPGNPRLDNLIWETPKANNARKKQHGTSQEGENHPNSKFTNQDVLDIRAADERGVRNIDLAKKYNVSEFCISSIRLRKSWGHI